MEKYETGMLARSKAGHDVGRTYVIVGVDDVYVYLADGKLRTLAKPKKKKKKHIQVIRDRYDITNADDVMLKRILKEWKREES